MAQLEVVETYEDYQHFSISDKLAIAGTSLAFSLIITLLVVSAPK